jgi:hypothetical protein
LNDDETLTYLHSTVSSRRHPVKTPDTPIYLDHILTDQAYQPGEITASTFLTLSGGITQVNVKK